VKLVSMPYYEKWFILGAIIGVVAGLTAVTFCILLQLFEEVFITYF